MTDTLIAGGHRPIDEGFTGELTERENRADVTSLEGLHAERRQLLPEYAKLKALHGPNGKWDAYRKALLEALKIRHRAALTKSGEKITEAYIDALAHGDDQYVTMIGEAIDQATRYVELDTRMAEIAERIDDRKSSLFCYSAEARLT